jgi:hypothetical protein
MKLLDKKPEKELEVCVETLEECDLCDKKGVKGITFVNNYHQICFDCIEEMHKILLTPAK